MRKDAPIVAIFRTQIVRKDQIVLQDLSIEIEQGSWSEIIGVSGAGKSDLFRLLSLRQHSNFGQIVISGMNLEKMDERARSEARFLIGSCAQRPLFLENESAINNLLLPLQIRGQNLNESKELAFDLLDAFDLTLDSERHLSFLDEDDRLCVGIARALIGDVQLVLLDGVISKLSPSRRTLVLQRLILENQGGKTIVLFEREQQKKEEVTLLVLDRHGMKKSEAKILHAFKRVSVA